MLQLFLAASTAFVASSTNPEEALGAHQILKQLYILLSFATDAIAVAAQQLIASSPKDERPALVRRLVEWGAVVGAFFAVLLYFAAPLLVEAGSSDPVVQELALFQLQHVVAPLQLISSLVFVGDGVLQGSLAFRFEAIGMAFSVALASAALFLAPHTQSSVFFGVRRYCHRTVHRHDGPLDASFVLSTTWNAVCVLQFSRLAAFAFFCCTRKDPPTLLETTRGSHQEVETHQTSK